LGVTGTEKLTNPNGLAVDDAGNIFVADTNGKRIVKFDKDGTFVAAFKDVAGEGVPQMETPVDVAIGPGGNVYVLDRGTGRLPVYTAEGKFVASWGEGAGFYNPFGLGAGKDAVYVADTGSGRVVKFGPNGEKVADMAKNGSEGGAREPSDVYVDVDGTVLIVDGGSARVLRYSAEGKFDRAVEVAASGQARLVKLPDGSYLVSDPGKHRLVRWDAQGKFLANIASQGDDDARFHFPTGLAVDKSGAILVADSQANRVLKIQLEQP
jgi:tripartite motif-containing protein 71